MNLTELTRRLIDIPSVTGDESAVARFIGEYLGRLGFEVELQPVEGDRWNVLATTGQTARVVFSTHLDTVPPFLPSSDDGEFIAGRGACDAKGIIAAQIAAVSALFESGEREIGLLFTVDEEGGSLGARVANQHPLGAGCRYLINGEPTDNKLATGSKGSLRFSINASGRDAHSAYPEQGESAVEILLGILQDVRSAEWPSDGFFGATTCNIGVISGGTRPNVIPSRASATLQIRLARDAAPVKHLVESAVGGRARIEWLSECAPLRLMEVSGFETCVVRFTTDIPYLGNWGTPLLIGPGSILSAHTPDERIAKRELHEAAGIYTALARRLFELLRADDLSEKGAAP